MGEDVAHLGHAGDVVAGEGHEELIRGKTIGLPLRGLGATLARLGRRLKFAYAGAG